MPGDRRSTTSGFIDTSKSRSNFALFSDRFGFLQALVRLDTFWNVSTASSTALFDSRAFAPRALAAKSLRPLKKANKRSLYQSCVSTN
jgi:hypothetical protein